MIRIIFGFFLIIGIVGGMDFHDIEWYTIGILTAGMMLFSWGVWDVAHRSATRKKNKESNYDF